MAEIHKRLAEVMSEVSALKKDKRNEKQGYMFRSYEAFYNMLQPKLAEKKIFTLPSHETSFRETYETKAGGANHRTIVRVKYTLFAEDGSFVEGFGEGEGVDTFDKSTSKAFTMSYKSFITTLFMIPFDADPDGQTPESRAASRGGAKTQGQTTVQPAAGKQPQGAEKTQSKEQSINPCDFVITSKDASLNGKKIKEVEVEVLRMLLDSSIRFFEEKKKKPGPDAQSFIDATSEYLLQLDKGNTSGTKVSELPPKTEAPEAIPLKPQEPKATPKDLGQLLQKANNVGMSAHDLYAVIEKEYSESFTNLTQLTYSKIMNRLDTGRPSVQ